MTRMIAGDAQLLQEQMTLQGWCDVNLGGVIVNHHDGWCDVKF